MIGKKDKRILVTGATGHQGGAVIGILIKNGWTVRALTRKSSGDAFENLRNRGAEIAIGDMEDRLSVMRAVEGVYGVFLVTTFMESGTDGEIRKAKIVIDAARSAGIGHFIFSSVGAADKNTGIPHFESKREIELYLMGTELPSTIYRPVSFMTNFEMPQSRDSILNGILKNAYPENKKIQLLALEDLGAFVNIAFENPGEYAGKEIEIASDELTPLEICSAFSRRLGIEVRYERIPLETIRMQQGEDFYKMSKWSVEYGFGADIGKLKIIYPGLTSFDRWLDMHDWPKMKGKKAA